MKKILWFFFIVLLIWFGLYVAFISGTSLVYGADDPRLRIYPTENAMIFRGLDERSSPIFLQDGYALTADNVFFASNPGGVRQRYGTSLVNDFDKAGIDYEALTGLYYVKLSSGTEYRLVTKGTSFYQETSGTWTKVSEDTNYTTGSDSQFVFTTALDTVIFTNGSDTVQEWATTGVTVLDVSDLTDALTTAEAVIWFKNYLILGNTTEATSVKATRIRWSDVGTTETWDDDNYIDISVLGGQELVGFGVLYDNLYAFMSNSIYKITLVGGDEIFNITRVVENVGAIAKNSIVTCEFMGKQGIIFLSKDKTINFFDSIGITNVSYLIPTSMDGLSSTRLPYACAAQDGDSYFLSVCESGTNDLIIEINLDTADISKHTNLFANVMASVFDSNNNLQIYCGDYDSHLFQLYNEDNDDDIEGHSGTFETVSEASTATASNIQVVFDTAGDFTCTGALVTLTSGTGNGEQRVITGIHRTTGIIVDSAFTTTPDATSTYKIGYIDSTYETKWYACGSPMRRKHFGELYFWGEAITDSNLTVDYARDFNTYVGSQSVSLSGTDAATWGTSIWGTDEWGGEDAILRRIKLKGDGRYIKFKLTEDDIDEAFNIYGWTLIYFEGDVL